MYNAAVRIGPKIDSLSAANAMLTACGDTGPRNRRGKSLFARRNRKTRTQVNRNKEFRSGCQNSTAMEERGRRDVQHCSYAPHRGIRKTTVVRRRAGTVISAPLQGKRRDPIKPARIIPGGHKYPIAK